MSADAAHRRKGTGYMNAYPPKRNARRQRADACGHRDATREHAADGTWVTCNACLHTWREVST